MYDYTDVFLNALNNSPANATPIGQVVSSTNYNALLWKKVNTDRNMTGTQYGGYDSDMSGKGVVTNDGSFFVVATFSGDTPTLNTTLTGNLIYNNFVGKLEFDDYGNLHTTSTDGTGYTWNNPLTPAHVWSSSNTSQNTPFAARNDIVVSSNGKWILMRDLVLSSSNNQIYYVLYNPIHSLAFKTYYNRITDPVVRLSDPLPQKYCEIMADKTKNPANNGISNPIATSSTNFQQFTWNKLDNTYNSLPGDCHRNYGDVACNLLYNRECVNYASGGQINIPFDYANYGYLSENCLCSARNGVGSLIATVANEKDSFISTFATDALSVLTTSNKCPSDLKIITCTNTNISGGNQSQIGNTTNILCGVDPVDCSYSNIDWGTVECVGNPNPDSNGKYSGTKTATQKIVKQALGGIPCDTPDASGNITRTQPCTPTPVDAIMTGWVDQGQCSTPCGPGTKTQTRSVAVPASYGGVSGNLTQTVACNLGPCATPVTTAAATPATTAAATPATTAAATPATTAAATPAATAAATPSPTPTSSVSSKSNSSTTPAPASSPLSSNTTIIIGAVVVVGAAIAIYFYMKSKAK